ncbi:MAG: NAD(P)H-hydrate epimerase [Pseudomonadota bacterium]
MTDFPRIDRDQVPELTTAQMIEVDRAMIDHYGIELIQMMENAGRSLAQLAKTAFLGGAPQGKRVTVLAGAGGNGGGAMVAARRLAAWGADMHVSLSQPPEYLKGVPAHQHSILQEMGVEVVTSPPQVSDADLILDGLIGYALQGAPRGLAGELIGWASDQSAAVLSLDTPSGLDTTTGTAHDPGIVADATLTLALPKKGLRHPRIGTLYLGDISVPPDLYWRFLNLEVGPIFAASDILRLD